jgi:sarcosine oxidase
VITRSEKGNSRFDVVIVGLGAMGSAAAFHLARRGAKILGLDQFSPPHTNGSSHGETRVIREAYFEHPSYVPLVQRAYSLWEQLESESGEELYRKTGGLMLGAADSTVVRGSICSAREHRLPHEILDSGAIRSRFPGLNPGPAMQAVLEPRAGILFPEKCVAAHLRLAAASGAAIRTNEKAVRWDQQKEGIKVGTDRGTYFAKKLILAAGPWLRELVQGFCSDFLIERQVLLWFQATDPCLFTPDCFPIHLWEYEPGKMFYGFPDLGTGVKVAFHHQGDSTTPATVDRNVARRDIDSMRALLRRFLPCANGEFLRGTVCLYTNTPDGHFLIDTLPGAPNVLVASPCSGHGFKFASAVGEVLAEIVLTGRSSLDLSLFRWEGRGNS